MCVCVCDVNQLLMHNLISVYFWTDVVTKLVGSSVNVITVLLHSIRYAQFDRSHWICCLHVFMCVNSKEMYSALRTCLSLMLVSLGGNDSSYVFHEFHGHANRSI